MEQQAKHTPSLWQPQPVGDHHIVTRWYPQGGHETLKAQGARTISKFRSAEAADRAATLANLIDAYQCAMKVDPLGAEGHAMYYASELRRQLGMNQRAASYAIAKATAALPA